MYMLVNLEVWDREIKVIMIVSFILESWEWINIEKREG